MANKLWILAFAFVLSTAAAFWRNQAFFGILNNRGKRSVGGTVVEAMELTEEQKKVGLDRHNYWRNNVRPIALDMTNLTWHDDLAELAVNYSRECIYAHNDDRAVDDFHTVGENVYAQSKTESPELALKEAIDTWDIEKLDYDYHSLTCNPGAICGHYTQVVWANTKTVGCGVTLCKDVDVGGGDIWESAMIVVCNYGPTGNWQGEYPYTAGVSHIKTGYFITLFASLLTYLLVSALA